MGELSTIDYLKSSGVSFLDSQRKYWFVRTEGGTLFDRFIAGSYIAFAWDKLNDLSMMVPEKYVDLERAARLAYPKYRNFGLLTTQLIRFASEMRNGDVIIIPSSSSKELAFGVLEDENAYIYTPSVEEYGNGENTDHLKRRRIQWVKRIERGGYDPALYTLLNSQHSITSADNYAPYIDRLITEEFVKGNDYHVVYNVEAKDGVSVVDVSQFLDGIIESVKTIGEIVGLDIDLQDLRIRMNVQSPGPIEIMTAVAIGGAALHLLTVALFGGKIEFQIAVVKFISDTKGIVPSVINAIKEAKEFQKADESVQKVKEYAKAIKIHLPDEEDD